MFGAGILFSETLASQGGKILGVLFKKLAEWKLSLDIYQYELVHIIKLVTGIDVIVSLNYAS